jgi:integrase/recombinase XerD
VSQLDHAIESFLAAGRVERALARNTLEAYHRDLTDLAAFLRGDCVANWVGAPPPAAWMVALATAGCRRARSPAPPVAMRQPLRFLHRESTIPGDPSERSRGRARVTAPQTHGELTSRPSGGITDPTTALGLETPAMLEPYATGSASAELVGPARTGTRTAGLVRGKGSGAIVPYGDRALALSSYPRARRDAGLSVTVASEADDAPESIGLAVRLPPASGVVSPHSSAARRDASSSTALISAPCN